VHDFDAIRWVSGREIVQVYATGANRGEEFFLAAGDVDTASATLTLDDGTLATVSCGRYNGAGYDVRLEVLGSEGSVCAGLDDRMALRSGEPGTSFPAGPAYRDFMTRFGDAYVAELTAFLRVAAGEASSQCTPQDALEASYVAEACDLSRHRQRPVLVAEVRQ
jgi:myo-inositol 2-dehydrogenase/D-chiro-inositol 1-dehydrogenase